MKNETKVGNLQLQCFLYSAVWPNEGFFVFCRHLPIWRLGDLRCIVPKLKLWE